MDDIVQCLGEKKHLIANAPTGLGKTAATLVPALEYALDNGKTVFFLTPKHTQHQIAVETLKKMKQKRSFIGTDLIGKKWMCSVLGIEELNNHDFNEYCKAVTKDERCQYLNATRSKDRLLTKEAKKEHDKLFLLQPFHAEEAKSDVFCGYEFLTEFARKSNVIIGDYYHIFSPAGASTFAKLGRKIEDAIIIVDEAHNLPSRVRSIASDKLSSFVLRRAAKEARAFGFSGLVESIQMIEAVIDDLDHKMLGENNATSDAYASTQLASTQSKNEAFVTKENFSEKLQEKINNMDVLIDDFHDASAQIMEEKKKSSLSSLTKFLKSWEGESKGFTRILKRAKLKSGKSYTTLNYACLDPQIFTAPIFEECHSAILMSGTLEPQFMYRDLLGIPESRAVTKTYMSPFPKTNRLCIVVDNVTTRYSKRSENYGKIAEHVIKCSEAIPGNVAVFFPSYRFRDVIFEMVKDYIEKEIILEQQGASKSERRRIYDAFVANYEKGSVLFAVQGGSFSEGVDLPGKFLNGAVIVGVPLEMPNLETKAMIDYYDMKFSRGWDYGYTYPAVIRSIQSAGRCIRSETDRGVCIFVDERFKWTNYRKIFPQDWTLHVSSNPEPAIKEFFSQSQ
ncbi:MAG: ATP-dependent DNA helicase [Candidatus Aenigmarchaeota archaeon]|nr:ATP-dependent DNA helicase [Candidatus Aenigmarchaeota archaeon]